MSDIFGDRPELLAERFVEHFTAKQRDSAKRSRNRGQLSTRQISYMSGLDQSLELLAERFVEHFTAKQREAAKHSRDDRGSGSVAVGEILRRYRGPLSIRKLASMSGLDQSFIGRIESGQRGMSLETLSSLHSVLGTVFVIEVLEAIYAERSNQHSGSDRPEALAGQPQAEGGTLDQTGDQGGNGSTVPSRRAASLRAYLDSYEDEQVRSEPGVYFSDI